MRLKVKKLTFNLNHLIGIACNTNCMKYESATHWDLYRLVVDLGTSVEWGTIYHHHDWPIQGIGMYPSRWVARCESHKVGFKNLNDNINHSHVIAFNYGFSVTLFFIFFILVFIRRNQLSQLKKCFYYYFLFS